MMKKTLLLGIALLVSQPSFAKDYIVELLVFKHPSRTTGIAWQPGILLPKDSHGISVFGQSEREDFVAMPSGPALGEMAQELSNSRKYPLIAYRTWQQPGLAIGSAEEIQFNLGSRLDAWDTGSEPPRAEAQYGIGDEYKEFTLASDSPLPNTRARRTNVIAGTVKVSLGRYLHLYTDLVYTDTRTGMSSLQKSHRRMRSKRTHYIDNPAFGIIAHITPVEEPEEEQPLEESAEDTVRKLLQAEKEQVPTL